MSQQHSARKRKNLSLPHRLVAELTALGHSVSSNSNNWKARKITESSSKAKPSSSKLKSGTALEKLLIKQQPQLAKKSKNLQLKSRTQEEQFEDQQIAWLESQLGLKTGQESKAKLRQEFQQDGLEDLFDGLDELDQLVENLNTSQDPDDTANVDVNLDEDDMQADQLGSESGHSLDSGSTWHGCENNVDGDDNVNNHDSDGIGESMALNQPSQLIAQQDPQECVLSSDNPKRYIPPHLRSKQEEPPKGTGQLDKAPLDLRLKRQMMGILNRVSPTSVPVCLTSLRELYVSHPRAVITHGLGDLILGLISSKDSLSPALLVTYAALVSAITRGGVQVSGVEIGWAATFIAELAFKICEIYDTADPVSITAEGFGKSGINLLGFLSHLYFFQVVSCILVYDVVRLLIESGLSEHRVEGLIVLLKACGFRLRHDDPSALKDIIILVQGKRKNFDNPNPRTKFMLDTLTDLKNNKVRKEPQSINGTSEELQENLKKYLGGLSKKTGSDPEPIQFKLKDLQEAHKKGKWWLIGAGWNGNPLVDEKIQLQSRTHDSTDKVMMDLARRQGMNTDVRRSIFNAIMTGEDYVDACEKINQLGLNSVQQREIIRVLLHCLGKEKNYNPYYTMIGQKLASESRSIQITMQYLLWDFFRELGEKQVGGQEMLKNLNHEQNNIQDDYHSHDSHSVDSRKLHHLAWAYGWWIAKGSLPIIVLKPLPFECLKQKTQEFLSILISLIFLSIHSTSPTLIPPSSTISPAATSSSTKSTKMDSSLLETIFKKLLTNCTLSRAFLGFLVDETRKTGYEFYVNKLIKQPLISSDDSSKNLDFFGLTIPQTRLVYFLNLITQSKSFLVDFLSEQL